MCNPCVSVFPCTSLTPKDLVLTGAWVSRNPPVPRTVFGANGLARRGPVAEAWVPKAAGLSCGFEAVEILHFWHTLHPEHSRGEGQSCWTELCMSGQTRAREPGGWGSSRT